MITFAKESFSSSLSVACSEKMEADLGTARWSSHVPN